MAHICQQFLYIHKAKASQSKDNLVQLLRHEGNISPMKSESQGFGTEMW
jgi:hypothetical protein